MGESHQNALNARGLGDTIPYSCSSKVSMKYKLMVTLNVLLGKLIFLNFTIAPQNFL